MTEWIPAGLEPGSVGERVYASTSEAEAREAIGAAAEDDARLAGAVQAGADLADLSDPAAALAQLKGARLVGLFVELEGETVGEGARAVFTAGHTRDGVGAARYVLDADQTSPTLRAWRRRSADGFWFVLDEAEPSFEQFGALGQADHLNPVVDDTSAIVGGAVAWSNLTGRPVRASGRIYNVRDTIELTYGRLRGVGSTSSGNGALATSGLLFSHLGAKPGVRVALATSKKLALIEGFDLRAASWDPVTGCTGYGLDVGARLIARDLSVQHWGKSALFLHGDGVFGGASTGGPYFSRFESCRFLYAREHGAVVGTGANAVTFVDCEWKWNGAPSHGVAPSTAGTADGLFVGSDAEGNPGNTYAQYWPEGLTIIGGDASYNSRYGVNYERIRDSANLSLGYAEHNMSADGYQVRVGTGVMNANINFGAVSGGSSKVKTTEVFGSYPFTNRIMVGGENLGGGGAYSASYDLARIGAMLASDEAGSEVRTVGSVSRTGKWKARLDGTGAEWNIGYNLSGGAGHVEEITVNTVDGVRLPARGRGVKFLTFVPIANRGAVIAGTYVGDATVWLQAAIDTGRNIDLEGVTIYAGGVTMASNQQVLFSSAGPANIYKNANGPILTVNAADVLLAHVVFRGVSAAYTGHNVVLNGKRPRLEFCGSIDAEGRAVYGPTADKAQIYGYTYGYLTADLTGAGYDIELGNAATATLYHQISNIYSGGVNIGGILLVNPGSHSITDSLIGKLTIQNMGNPAGSNGGKHAGNRILGNVSIGLPSATFANNQFGGVSLTFEGGTSGCVVDASNVFSGGFTVANNGNGNNLIMRQTSGGGSPEITYGAAANAIAIQYEPGTFARLKNGGLCLPNNIALASRNVGNTADKALIYMSTSAGDNVFVGHGSGTGSLTLQGGSGGVGVFVAGTPGVTFGTFTATGLTPGTNSTFDLGTSALRFKNIYGGGLILTGSADVSSYKVNGTKVLGSQEIGWTAATGAANKGAYATYAGTSASPGYVQAEAQAVINGLKGASERIKALEDMLRTHGLIN